LLDVQDSLIKHETQDDREREADLEELHKAFGGSLTAISADIGDSPRAQLTHALVMLYAGLAAHDAVDAGLFSLPAEGTLTDITGEVGSRDDLLSAVAGIHRTLGDLSGAHVTRAALSSLQVQTPNVFDSAAAGPSIDALRQRGIAASQRGMLDVAE